MKRTPSSKPRKPLRRVSPKRAVENRLYTKLRKQFLAEYPFCQAQYPGICTERTVDPHHKEGRGKNLNRVDTWMAVCRQCHDEIHRHPRAARVFGFLK